MLRSGFALIVLSCSLSAVTAQDKDRLKQDEDQLREAGVALDGASLLEFFRVRTPGEKALEGIEELVRNLGNDAFPVRQHATEELMRIGPQALAALRPLANHADPEIRSRARTCIAFLEKSVRPELMSAAVRVLADRKPSGAVKMLLAHLPATEDSYLIEEIHTALAVVGIQAGKIDPILKEALADKHPRRRAASAAAIVRAGKVEERALVRPLLKDADVRVRAGVAIALVERKEREAVATLIDALADAPAEQLWHMEQLLFALAGDNAPKATLGSTDVEKRAYRTAWLGWWNAHGDKVDMKALDAEQRVLGLTLLVQYDLRVAAPGGRIGQGRVIEVGPDGKTRWEITNLNYPVDAEIVGRDRVLITEYRTRQVTERNFKGETLWTKAITGYPVSAQRLPNGNTLIADRSSVMEVTPAGNEVSKWATPGSSLIGARRARNGEIVVLDAAGTIYRLDAKGRVVKTARTGVFITASIGSHFDLLPNGNVLVPVLNTNKVMEFDGDGKKVWEATSNQPCSCTRLANGNTLVSSRLGRNAVELDRTGKQVWTYNSQAGYILQARRR